MQEIRPSLITALYKEEERLRERGTKLEHVSKAYLAAAKIVGDAAYALHMFNGREEED